MPSKKNEPELTPQAILRDYPLEIQAIAGQLRVLVKELVPEAVEKAHPGWRGIGYHHPTAGYFCGIFPQQDEVRLLFEWGVLLAEPDNLLIGDGRQVRYIPVTDIKTVDLAALGSLISAALALPESVTLKRQRLKNKDH